MLNQEPVGDDRAFIKVKTVVIGGEKGPALRALAKRTTVDTIPGA